jgi:hypothetical protein
LSTTTTIHLHNCSASQTRTVPISLAISHDLCHVLLTGDRVSCSSLPQTLTPTILHCRYGLTSPGDRQEMASLCDQFTSMSTMSHGSTVSECPSFLRQNFQILVLRVEGRDAARTQPLLRVPGRCHPAFCPSWRSARDLFPPHHVLLKPRACPA